jgi:hypothetical protein
MPLAGWAIVVTNGKTLLGRWIPGAGSVEPILSPVYEMSQSMGMTDQGPVSIPVLKPFANIPSIKRVPVPVGAIVIMVHDLDRTERQALAQMARNCEAQLAQEKAAASGVLIARDLPRSPR